MEKYKTATPSPSRTVKQRLHAHGITGKPGEPIGVAPVLDRLDQYAATISRLLTELEAADAALAAVRRSA